MHMEPSSCIRSGASTSRADHAGVLGPGQHNAEGALNALPRGRAQSGVLLERLVQLVQEALLARRIADEGLEPGHERGPGLQLVAHRVGDRLELVDVVDVDRLHHVDALGEVPVQRADPDAGLLGDGLHGRTATLLVEDLAGGRHQELVVALGVGPHRARRLGVVRALDRRGLRLRRHSPAFPPGPAVTPAGAGATTSVSKNNLKEQSCKAEAPSVY